MSQKKISRTLTLDLRVTWVLAGSLGYCFSLVSPQLVLGPSGVLQGIRPGKCYVDMSTVDADTVTELAQVAALFRLALHRPFSWIPRPRLTAPQCGPHSYSRATAETMGF